MAKAPSNPAAMMGDVARFSELRSRLLFLIGALIVYRIGTFIPVPGIDPVAMAGQRLVHAVVDDFHRQVVGAGGVRVHARTAFDGFKSCKDFNVFGAVLVIH